MPLKTVGNSRISWVREPAAHHRHVEQAVGVIGVGADQHSAAVAAGVAERRQGQVGDDLALAVEDQPERQRPKSRDLGDDGQVVAHPAVRPAHPVDPVADQRVETGCGDGAEPGVGAVGTPDAPEVDGLGVAGGDHVDAPRPGRRSGSRYSRAWSLPVPAGTMPERNSAARQRLQREPDHAVATDDDEGVGPLGHRLAGPVPGRARRRGRRSRRTSMPSSWNRATARLGGVRRVAVAGHRVGQDGDARDAVTESACPG